MRSSIDSYKREALAKEKLVVVFLFLSSLAVSNCLNAQKKGAVKDRFEKKSIVGKQKDGSYIVPTSQIIDPAGTTIAFPGRPVDLALNPGETILAVKNLSNIVFFDALNQSIKQSLALPAGGNTFTGIGWSDNGTKVWTTDTRGYLRSAKLQGNGLFAWSDTILLPSKTSATAALHGKMRFLTKLF